MQPSEGDFCQRVAFRTHPAQTAEYKSVEQPWLERAVFVSPAAPHISTEPSIFSSPEQLFPASG
jgi:hypothetical protein